MSASRWQRSARQADLSRLWASKPDWSAHELLLTADIIAWRDSRKETARSHCTAFVIGDEARQPAIGLTVPQDGHTIRIQCGIPGTQPEIRGR